MIKDEIFTLDIWQPSVPHSKDSIRRGPVRSIAHLYLQQLYNFAMASLVISTAESISSQKYCFTVTYDASKAVVSSLESREPVPALKFINRSPTPVALFWLDFSGEGQFSGTVQAGAQRE
jgi:hypothetical protein